MSMAALRALERIKDRYGDAHATDAKLASLQRLAHADLASARAVARLHELLCFLRAYPDNARVLAQVERMLAAFERRADLRREREALENTGIAGAAIRYRFFWPTLHWLARNWPRQIRMDRDEPEIEEKLASALPLLLTWAEAAALKQLDPPAYASLDRLRARGESDAAFLALRIAAMPGDGFTREAFHDAIEQSYELASGAGTPARTHARYRAAPFAYQHQPFMRARPDLRGELARPYQKLERLSVREGVKLIALARSAMVTRSRDLDAFAYGNGRDVRLVDDGDGLGFALIGIIPERRLLLRSTCGYLVLRNGVPIGYGEAFVIGRAATVTFNLFESFRGGEAARTCARMLAMVRHVFGAQSFSFDQYQLGKGNDEAVDSGAWWFYYKLGFRPLRAEAQRILRAELARMRQRPGHRSDTATLRALAESHMIFDMDAARPLELPPLELPGLRVSAALSKLPAGARERALKECELQALRITGVSSLRGFSAAERLAWKRWSPIVVFALRGVTHWTLAERRALARVIRAKGGRDETEFLQRFAAHPKLERALFG